MNKIERFYDALNPASTPMSNTANFQGLGRIILTFQKNGFKDDKLTIAADSETSGYIVTFLQNTIDNLSTNYLTNAELTPYLNRLFRTMEFDVQGYDCVQFDCPLYPTVIVERANLLNYYYILADQIASLQNAWPTEKSGADFLTAKKISTAYAGEGRLYCRLIKEGNKDDILCIRRQEDFYHIRYAQNHLMNSYESYMPASELIPYLQRFFTAVTCDAEPCTNVQVDFPMYPTVMLKTQQLHHYTPVLFEQIRAIDSWPTERSGKRWMRV